MKRHVILWTVIILAVALVLLMIRAAQASEPVTMYVICSDTYVNVRERPSTKAKIGGRLDFGDAAQVTETVTDSSGTSWYRVEGITEQGHGYVCANYLIASQPARCSRTGTISASGRVAVYKRVDGARKTWAKNGSKVTVKIYSDDWCQTDKGWIRTEYISFPEDQN